MILRDRVTRVSLVRVFFPARRGSRARTPRSFPRRVLPRFPTPRLARSSPLAARSARPTRSEGPERIPRTFRCSLALSLDAPPRSRGWTPRAASRTARRASPRCTRRRDSRKIVVEEPTRGEFGGGGGTGEIAAATRGCASPELGSATSADARLARSPISSRTPREGPSPREDGSRGRRRETRRRTGGRCVGSDRPGGRASGARSRARRGARAARRARLRPIRPSG